MPLFISHAAYLKKFWDENKYPQEYFYDGFLGNILPDVRYLTKQSREITHLEQSKNYEDYGQALEKIFKKTKSFIKSNQIPSENLYYFRKGFSFHTILDKWWPKQIYFPSTFDRFGLCLKLLDDILLKDEVNKLTIKNQFRLPYQFNFLDISDEIIKKWFYFVFWYIKKQPKPQNIKEILSEEKLFNQEIAEKVSRETNKIFKNQTIRIKLQDMYLSFNWDSISENQV